MPNLRRLNFLWNLQGLRNTSADWTLYVNYNPDFEDDRVTDIFDSSDNHYPIGQNSDLRPHIEGLDNEIYSKIDDYQPIAGLKPDEIRTHLVRKPFGGHDVGQNELKHRYEVFYANNTDGQSEIIEISSLSEAGQSTIQVLDDYARSRARRLYEADLEQYQVTHDIQTSPSRRIRVFIAHSKSSEDIAKQLYGILQKYGDGGYFDPILDEHDIPRGKLIPRLFEKIESSDVFLPIVTEDYAVEQSISRKEWEKARDTAASNSLDDFFAPIFLGSGTPDEYDQTDVFEHLSEYWYLRVDNEDEISEDNKELNQFLKRLAWSVPNRDGWG